MTAAPPTYAAIFFDVGGTLVDADPLFDRLLARMSLDQIAEARAEMVRRFSALKTEAEGEQFIDVKTMIDRVCEDVSHHFDVPPIGQGARDLYRKIYTDTVRLFPGVVELLSACRDRSIPLYILSDADADVLRPQLRSLRIADFFQDMIISSEAGAYKPSLVIAKAALKCIPDNAGQILMIGDSPDDVGVAQEMGAHSILIRDTPNHNAAVQPTWQVSRLTDISRLLWPDQG